MNFCDFFISHNSTFANFEVNARGTGRDSLRSLKNVEITLYNTIQCLHTFMPCINNGGYNSKKHF